MKLNLRRRVRGTAPETLVYEGRHRFETFFGPDVALGMAWDHSPDLREAWLVVRAETRQAKAFGNASDPLDR
jgi:hypothetical protein